MASFVAPHCPFPRRLVPHIVFPRLPVLSVIIPAYNEATRVGRTIEQVLAYLHAQPFSSELIVVSDGSTDDTGRVVEGYFATHPDTIATRLISYPANRGKGYAVRQGLLAATGTVALFSDADLSTPIEELHKVVDPILDGHYDVVFGSRALDRSLIGVHQPWLRESSGRVFNQIMQWATGLPYADTQCGFKAFRMAACRPIVEGAVLDRFGFDVELLFLYPWAVIAYSGGGDPYWKSVFGTIVFVEILVFLATLAIAYAYAWRKGVFQWR